MDVFKNILSALGIKNWLSVFLTELPGYIKLFIQPGTAWIYLTNRNDKTVPAIEGDGLSLLDDFTSLLRVPKYFPWAGKILYKNRLGDFSFTALNKRKSVIEPNVSIIIGHRGMDKLQHLQSTLNTIAAQSYSSLECIIIEQDSSPSLNFDIPDWVNYHFDEVEKNSLYNRSAAFNMGVKLAKGDIIILHDNDLLLPQEYVAEHIVKIRQGYDVVNLKRLIFGLNETDTNDFFLENALNPNWTPEYVMQNAKGGGSLVITKKSYNDIGGFDQRFVGWGGEDNEFWQRAQLLNIYPFCSLPLIHLWHPAQGGKRKGMRGGGEFTEQLIDDLSKISVRQRTKYLRDQHR